MSNAHSEKMPAKGHDQLRDLKRDQGDDSATGQENKLIQTNKQMRSLSKREIMEQLSRERFPWDE